MFFYDICLSCLPVSELVLTDEFIVVHIGKKINVYRE